MTRSRRALLVLAPAALLVFAVGWCAAGYAFPVELWGPQRLRGEPAISPQTLKPPVVVRLPHRVGLKP